MKTSATRARIEAAAVDNFLAKGFEATRMADVAASAGVAKGTLYLYFATKEKLFEGVLSNMLGDMAKLMGLQEIQADETVAAFLARVLGPLMTGPDNDRLFALFRLVLQEGPRFPELAAAYRRAALDPVLAALRLLAARARQRNETQADELERAPLLFLAPGLAATVWNALFPAEPLEPFALFEAFLRVAFPAAPVTSSGANTGGSK